IERKAGDGRRHTHLGQAPGSAPRRPSSRVPPVVRQPHAAQGLDKGIATPIRYRDLKPARLVGSERGVESGLSIRFTPA
ncbi:MAG: hypothetical protein LC793_22025, partial [Thermomicrobia bacterium]|nr:hypothetical protein [Thermomicrobia bacterium]